MPALAANARMYAVTPAVEDAWKRLFAWAGEAAGAPLVYVPHAAPSALELLWSRDDLGLAFMCGWPFSRAKSELQAIAAPIPAAARSQGRPVYWTDLVVKADSPFQRLSETYGGRIGWTVDHSQSGFNAIRAYLRNAGEVGAPLYRQVVGPLITPRRVIEAVLAGEIDVGPLDSYWGSLLQAYEAETAVRLRTVEQTSPMPIPLLVASPGITPEVVLRLRRALIGAAADERAAPLLAALRLKGFAAVERQHYGVLRIDAAKAGPAGATPLG